MDETSTVRKIEHGVDKLFPNRWSPRAMSGEEISKEDLMSLFEAARWAPSSRNNQPWRFIYAKRNTEHWPKLFNLLVEFNQLWCQNAAVLCVVISQNNFEHNNKSNINHSFDTGSAWENLALQGSIKNLVIHGMAGFDYDRAKVDLKVPTGYTVEMMFAVGKPGRKEDLPEEVQKREFPTDRKKISEIVFEGSFVQGG